MKLKSRICAVTCCLPQGFPPWFILNAWCCAEPAGSTTGVSVGIRAGPGCPTPLTLSWIQQQDPAAAQLEQSLSSEHSCDCCHSPRLRLDKSQLWFCAHIWALQWAQGPAQGSPRGNPAPGTGSTLLGLCWLYLQFCHVPKPHTNLSVQLGSFTMLLSVLLGPQTGTEARCNSVCQGLHFYHLVFKIQLVLVLNTLVAHYKASFLDDKQLNLHFSYWTCTFKIILLYYEERWSFNITAHLWQFTSLPSSLWWWLGAYRTTGQTQKEI